MSEEELAKMFLKQTGMTLEEAKKMIGKKLLVKEKEYREELLNDMHLDFCNIKKFAKELDMLDDFENMVLLIMMKDEALVLKKKIDFDQMLGIPVPEKEKKNENE